MSIQFKALLFGVSITYRDRSLTLILSSGTETPTFNNNNKKTCLYLL